MTCAVMALLHRGGLKDIRRLLHEMRMMNTYYDSEHQMIKYYDKCQADPPSAKDKALLKSTNENVSQREN